MTSALKSKDLGGKRKKSVQGKPAEVNLVSTRSGTFSEAASLSRSMSAENYAKARARKRRNNVLTTVISLVVAAAVFAVSTAFGIYKLVLEPRLDESLRTNAAGEVVDFDGEIYEGVFQAPESPMDPFFMLLIGLDDPEDGGGISRSDVLILLYIDPGAKKVAMISIPRDTRITIAGWGTAKINAAYAYGEIDHVNYNAGLRSDDSSGTALAVKTVSQFAGVPIAYSAVIDFWGFVDLVDDLGGVTVDVPVHINDHEAGPAILSPGSQVLNGEQALTFVRSRKFGMSDYQRQANQRTFLQALAKQILAGSPDEIYAAINNITNMVTTNMSMSQIVSLAQTFRGMQEGDIITYTVPSYSETIDEVSYVLVRDTSWRNLINLVAAGEFPDPADVGLSTDYLGVTPQSHQSGSAALGDGILTREQCAGFVVDVRNGWGIKNAARDVSDQLALAGYQQGEIANANSFVYDRTLIIYQTEADLPAANDVAIRLGYGKVIASLGRYEFRGDILVVVGEDSPFTR